MDVGGWLRGLGLGQYEEQFRDNKIDADLLPRLTVDDLKDIGVSVVGDRRRLLDAIAVIAGAGRPADAPASPTKFAPSKGHQASAERRPITVMFCDLVGSTSLAAKLDAEDWRNLVNAYLDEASAAVAGFGGHVLKKLGDGLMALFGYPHAQENDAERAVRAALAIHRALSDLNARNASKGAPELSARVGIEFGPVVMEASGEVFGDAPNVAARVQAAAEPGSVLITLNVQRQVAGLFVVEEQGARELRGVTEPVELFRIVRASGGGRRGGARTLTPFVGREEELGVLARRWERARAGEGQLVLIVGEPGLGKSRLIEEFHSQLTETPHTWSEWSASQLLQNTPLHPIAEWGRQRFGVDAPAEQRLADLENTLRLIGLDPAEHAPLLAPLVDIPLPPARAASFPPEELRRRQLAAMTALVLAGARSQPVVLAFEDLHWADPTSLDLLRALADRGAQAPLLLLATTRPEFRPPWSLRSHHSLISLSPLDRAGVARIIGEISASHALSKEVIEGVSERTGGVPLFVEEVTRLLLERGEQGGVQAIPPTLQQSLAARLDRLGPAREMAQIGAVLGRDFSYALLCDVAEADEPGLQMSLDRLAESDLLFVEGLPPQANYRFKHALIQDAAYDSLLKSRRQALHRRAAEALVEAKAQAEAIAHHFTEAGLDDQAIEWWGKAGDQALRRSAFQEAIVHLGKAIAMADKGGETGSTHDRLKLQTIFGQAMGWSRGLAAEETKAATAHATRLAAVDNDPAARLTVYYGQWITNLMGGQIGRARTIAETYLGEARNAGALHDIALASRLVGQVDLYQGAFADARAHLETALASYDPMCNIQLTLGQGADTETAATVNLAVVFWQLGEVERARELTELAKTHAVESGRPLTLAYTHTFTALFEVFRGHAGETLRDAKTIAQAAGNEFPRNFPIAKILHGWARARLNDREGGLEELRQGLTAYAEHKILFTLPVAQGFLSELEAEGPSADAALARIDEALRLARQTGERWADAFLHRIRGDILLKADSEHPARAEDAYLAAVAIAREQGARSFELRAALALARLYQSTGRPTDALAVLAPALEGFAPTTEMPQIAEAQALLAALAELDEVKAETARRQRLTQLHVSYGNALIAARGYGAPETTEAFVRARQSASGDKDAPERLAADYGLWVGSAARADVPSMRGHAAAFLSDVEARPDSPEAGVAHRVHGTTCWFAGEYREARHHLDRALALFRPGRDDDMAYSFGFDAGVSVMAYLAFVLWPLGEVDRAISLIDRMQTRMADITHVGTLANGRICAAFFELMRGDSARTNSNAFELARLAREHDLPVWGAFGMFLEGWATGRSVEPGRGLDDMRRGVEQLREQNVLFFDGLLKLALAEAEAREGDPDRAVAILDEALATADRLGYRAFEAELHQARGEILLERDPANPAPAEEAFLTAIAVGKQQGTRSFELRAALSLAKLYQSTDRPAEAHAILATALEGFSTTPEMPEIGEAQALLAALMATDEVKAAVAQRERRLHLQTAYGQAMMWSKGFASEETKAAFDRAAELTANSDDFSHRFAALHGQWTLALVRGELRAAREQASAFLKEAETRGRVIEAGVAHRGLALMSYFAGNFTEAQTHCERALAACSPENDLEARERSGEDTGTVALCCLALTSWQLGEVARARELIDEANQRAAEIGHVPSIANPLQFKSLLEILRGDASATLTASNALKTLSGEHGMTLQRNWAEATASWAYGHLHDPHAGADRLERALDAMVDRGVRLDEALYLGLLAQLEAEAFGADSALVRVDKAISLTGQGDSHFCLGFLHRLRGEFLLKRDPRNPAPAEEAYRTAIEVAKEQGARSYELLASFSLAKLYQSTGRLAEAHAVLAPSLKNFSPTSEMPEIAEAQALLVAIEAARM